LAFDVKVERDSQELADTLGVTIFTADIIYHLQDKFLKYREDLKKKKQEEFKNIAVFPCKLRVLPQFIFNTRDPIVMGVSVEAGLLKNGTPICVPSKEVNISLVVKQIIKYILWNHSFGSGTDSYIYILFFIDMKLAIFLLKIFSMAF